MLANANNTEHNTLMGVQEAGPRRFEDDILTNADIAQMSLHCRRIQKMHSTISLLAEVVLRSRFVVKSQVVFDDEPLKLAVNAVGRSRRILYMDFVTYWTVR
jgi:hypothetical protein